MQHDMLSDVLSAIKNADKVGKKEVITSSSKMIKEVLLILQAGKYIGEFEFIDDKRGGKFRIKLLNIVNNCGSIRPRFAVKSNGYEKYERRFLPAAGFGFLIVSTSKGIMKHADAKNQELGGKLLAFCY
ncbi:MAG: 30S ribosomal protein S8 [Candidatus Aenigmarchaeota archaeon]|nr:30S ribosomal protein S8 [Candidatus Aenigmarchaeota archaeon]